MHEEELTGGRAGKVNRALEEDFARKRVMMAELAC